MKKIVLIEDDPGIRDAIIVLLKHSGYQVSAHSNGQHLLEGDINLPDLFLLDNQLPGVTGVSICQHLKHQPATSHIPIIIFSASPLALTISKNAGADACLEKPFRMQQLRELIVSLIGTE
jgi:DNA-binding response OmpR family regulator